MTVNTIRAPGRWRQPIAGGIGASRAIPRPTPAS